jgi:hypothetical protein
MTPYEVIYGPKRLLVASYIPGTSKVHVVDRMIHTREEIIHILKDNLFTPQNRMKQQVDQHIFEHYFNEWDQEFLRVYPYK